MLSKTKSFLLSSIFIIGCAGIPDGVEPVENFELEPYLGTWYEIARLDNRFERGLSEITATYGMRDGGGVSVTNRGYDAEAGVWKDAEGKAFFIDDESVARLKVSFFGPFYGGYNVIALDSTEYSMIAGSTRKYLWILARDPMLNDATLDTLKKKAQDLGFATDALIYVEHGKQ